MKSVYFVVKMKFDTQGRPIPGTERYISQLTDDFTEAVKDYELTWEEHAALNSGDIRWIETHIGKLDNRLRTWLDCRLQQERW